MKFFRRNIIATIKNAIYNDTVVKLKKILKDQSQKNNAVNDPELKEWLDALENIISEYGNDRASFILGKLASKLTESGTIPDFNLTTPFRNSIPVNEEAKMPGDLFMERKIRSLIRSVSYTHLRAQRDQRGSRMPSSA